MGRRKAGGARYQTFLFPTIAVLLALTGLILRIVLAHANRFPTVDGTNYLGLAFELLETGRMPYSCFPPGWPLLISIPLLFFDRSDPFLLLRAAQTANVILGALLPVLSLILFRRHLGRVTSLSAMAVLVLLPHNLILSKGDLSEMAFSCVLLGAWLMLGKNRRLVAGLLFGFAYLVRPEALFAVGALGVWAWWRDRRLPWRLWLGTGVFLAPYVAYVRLAGGVWGLSSKDEAFTLSLQAHPGWDYPVLVAANLGEFLPHLPGLLGLPLVLLALWGAVRKPGRWLWLLAPLLVVPLVINAMVIRFWVPYLPLILLAAGLGGEDLVRRNWRLPARTPGWLTPMVLVCAVIAGLGLAAGDDLVYARRNTEAYTGLKDAGDWLRPRVEHDTVIAAYKPYTSFWAGCRFVKIPDEPSAEAIVAWARDRGAEYLIVNVQVVRYHAHGLDPLLERTLRPGLAREVEFVDSFEYNDPAYNTVIYRLRDR